MIVLTIDLDVIMHRSLPAYNHFIGPDYTIEEVMRDYPFLHPCESDLYIYEQLTVLLTKLFKRLDSSQIVFIEHHDKILDFTEDLPPFSLINIDHHHDIGYHFTSEDWERPLLRPDVDCGNWVKYLADNKQLSEYLWIRNDNSILDGVPKKYEPQIIEIPGEGNYLDDIANNADKVFVCASFRWIPRMYQPLYQLWIDLYQSHYEIDNVRVY